MRAVLRAAGALSVVSLLAAPAAATTYQRVADADLADQAAVIVEARVLGSGAASDGRQPFTDYQFEVEEAIHGAAAGDRLTVRVPGGQRSDGPSLQIWGAPRFEADEPALLFLAPNGDGSFHILHLMLGAFHEAAGADGRRAAVRDLSEAKEVSGAPADPPRDLDRFRAWLADRAAGVRRAPDYFLAGGGFPRSAGEVQPAQRERCPHALVRLRSRRERGLGSQQRRPARSAGRRLRRVPARPRGLERRAHDPHPLCLHRPDQCQRRARELRWRQRHPVRAAGRRSVRLRPWWHPRHRRALVRHPPAGHLGGPGIRPYHRGGHLDQCRGRLLSRPQRQPLQGGRGDLRPRARAYAGAQPLLRRRGERRLRGGLRRRRGPDAGLPAQRRARRPSGRRRRGGPPVALPAGDGPGFGAAGGPHRAHRDGGGARRRPPLGGPLRRRAGLPRLPADRQRTARPDRRAPPPGRPSTWTAG